MKNRRQKVVAVTNDNDEVWIIPHQQRQALQTLGSKILLTHNTPDMVAARDDILRNADNWQCGYVEQHDYFWVAPASAKHTWQSMHFPTSFMKRLAPNLPWR
jgi:hypothetical protein